MVVEEIPPPLFYIKRFEYYLSVSSLDDDIYCVWILVMSDWMRGILSSRIHPLRGRSSKPGGLTPSRCDKNMIGLAQTLCVILINAIFSELGENGMS